MQALQSSVANPSVIKTMQNIVSRYGVIGLFRGVSAVAAGAGK